ncbi:MAG: histidine kinase N-terminal 7TM domain-containing protein [Methanobacterium sp.]
MSLQYSNYGIILLLSAIIVLFLGIWRYRKRSSSLDSYFVLLMISVFFWCFGSSMEFFSVDILTKISWIKLSYIGVATAAPLWLLFVLNYCKYNKYLKPTYIGLLLIIPLIVLIMTATNEWHMLLWPSIIPSSNIPGSFLIYEHGPIFWLSIIYSFASILTGIFILIKRYFNSSNAYHRQILILLISGLIPLISSILYTSKILHIPGLDITPFGLTISGILIAVNVFKFNFLDILPIAHEILFKNMANGFLVFDAEDRLIEINEAANIINISQKDIGKKAEVIFSNYKEIKSAYRQCKPESETFIGEPLNKWVQVQITPIYNNEEFQGRLVLLQNITQRKSIENDLINSEERYRVLTELSPDAIVVIIDRKIVFVNNASLKIMGSNKINDIIGKDILSFIHEDFKEISKKRLYEVYIKRRAQEFIEEKIVNLKGEIRDIEVGDVPIIYNNQLAVQLVIRDITERKKLEKELKKSLDEKDLMMKEIHHRVKNNLMIIQSLLQLQSRYIKDTDTLNVFKESQNRAKSMALIHQRLYQSNDLKKIDFGDYARTLSFDIFNSYAADPNQIKLNVEADDAMLDINTAIPLGLILNELVSNSLKHAFSKDSEGKVGVEFHKEKGKYKLTVIDNGKGIPKGFDYENSDSLGLKLVYSLSGQINANLELDTTNGTKFEITFEEEY